MTVLFGTLGFRPQSLIPSIKSTENLEKVIFYHSSHKKAYEARRKIVDYCEQIGVVVAPIEVPDPFNLIPIAKRIRKDISKTKNEGKTISKFNVGGGTRLMSSAALLACILEGVPTTYVHDETLEEISLPLLRIEYSTALTDKQKEILGFLLRQKEGLPEKSLASGIGIHKSTMNHHIKELKRKGMVTVESSPHDARIRIIKVAPFVDLLIE